MREVLTGTVSHLAKGRMQVQVGALNVQEVQRFHGRTVSISLVDTHESLLKELVKEVEPVVGRNVHSPHREQRVKDLLGRIEKLVSQ